MHLTTLYLSLVIVYVKENGPIGEGVMKLTATDADLGNSAKISYSIIAGNSASMFTIDRTSGAINTSASIDYERKVSYNLTVSASDSVHITMATVLIEIVNVNDNKPSFAASHYTATVRENSAVMTTILQVSANDVDPFGQLVYSIEPGNAFSIDPISGNITTADILDREMIDKYVLNVTVTDGGEPALSGVAKVTVTVSDVNDNPPVFSKNSSLSVLIAEDISIGKLVLKLHSTDADIGVNKHVRYRFVSGSTNSIFAIEPLTGQIKTVASLDRENISSYVLYCQAYDEGTPSLDSNKVAVHVSVSDVNDNSPKFDQLSYVANVKEGVAVGTVVKELVAVDIDAGSNGDVEYAIHSGKQDGVFNIGKTTG